MSGNTMNLRCRTKDGQHVLSLDPDTSVASFLDMISAVSNIKKEYIKLKAGFPPQYLVLDNVDQLVRLIPLRNGDTVIVEEDSIVKVQAQAAADQLHQEQLALQQSGEGIQGMLLRKVVPADNCCLFTSVHYVMNDGKAESNVAPNMRQLIVDTVSADKTTYTEAFLGKTNSAYCKFIMDKESWGGGIELSILCKYYTTEICVLDTQSGRVDRFGEDAHYQRRVFLIYDGIHYDPLYFEAFAADTNPVKTMFSTSDVTVMSQALELVAEAQSARQFTDTESFELRCMTCQVNLKGQAEASEHAKTTGHTNFGENQ